MDLVNVFDNFQASHNGKQDWKTPIGSYFIAVFV